MIKIYDIKNKINEEIAKELYEILIENLFITYPEFLKEKDKYDNKDNFNKWYTSIANTESYEIMTYSLNDKIIAFFSYSIIDEKLWISEVQILNSYKKRGILKEFIKQFILIEKNSKYNEVYLHINSNNLLSQKVFRHIGFNNIDGNIYSIKIIDLIKWINK